MKIPTLCLALGLAIVTIPAIAAPENKPAPPLAAPAEPDATWLAKAKAAYPLKTCVVSEESLDEDAIDFVYKQEGQPDRLVRFCCRKCLKEFSKDPAPYLKTIDEAAAKAKLH